MAGLVPPARTEAWFCSTLRIPASAGEGPAIHVFVVAAEIVDARHFGRA
jgi:hypothetical protein